MSEVSFVSAYIYRPFKGNVGFMALDNELVKLDVCNYEVLVVYINYIVFPFILKLRLIQIL